jgi:hypothetical protein
MGYENDDSVAVELTSYIDNTGTAYEDKMRLFAKLLRFVRKGTYDHGRAPEMFDFLVEHAAKSWHREFSSKEGNWYSTFPQSVRQITKQRLADEFVRWSQREMALSIAGG